MYVIQSHSQKANTQGESLYFQAGEQAQKDLATCGSTASFAQRYVMVLEELRKEAQDSIKRKQNKNTELFSTEQPQLVATNSPIVATQKPSDLVDQAIYQHAGIGDAENGIPQAPDGMINPQSQALESSDVPLESQGWVGDLMEDTSPASYIADLTSWGEFDSLALTGLGELGFLFPSEGSVDFGH